MASLWKIKFSTPNSIRTLNKNGALLNLAPKFKFFQTLAIDKWNTDSVEEFLDIYLIKDEAANLP